MSQEALSFSPIPREADILKQEKIELSRRQKATRVVKSTARGIILVGSLLICPGDDVMAIASRIIPVQPAQQGTEQDYPVPTSPDAEIIIFANGVSLRIEETINKKLKEATEKQV